MTKFKNILVGLNAEFPDAGVVRQAVEIAKRDEAKLKLLDSVREFSWLSKAFTPRHEQLMTMLLQERREKLDKLAVEIGASGVDVSTRVDSGRNSEVLIGEVINNGHDLVIRSAKGKHSRREGFLGNTAMRLLRKCPCPVWLTKPDQPRSAARVLAAVDATPEDDDHGRLNFRILELANGVCSGPDNLLVAYVWEVFGEDILRAKMPEEEYSQLAREFHDRNEASFGSVLASIGLRTDSPGVFLEHGDPARAIPRIVEENNVDLLVMGTVARTGFPGLLIGNTAESLLEQIKCGLLAIKPQSFDAPSE